VLFRCETPADTILFIFLQLFPEILHRSHDLGLTDKPEENATRLVRGQIKALHRGNSSSVCQPISFAKGVVRCEAVAISIIIDFVVEQ